MFGDIDHPSFAAAFLGRVLTAAGYAHPSGAVTRVSADALNRFIAEHTVGSIEHHEP